MVNPQGNIRWNTDRPSQTIESNQDIFLINITICDTIEQDGKPYEASRVERSAISRSAL